jgi:hypothetical protein
MPPKTSCKYVLPRDFYEKLAFSAIFISISIIYGGFLGTPGGQGPYLTQGSLALSR